MRAHGNFIPVENTQKVVPSLTRFEALAKQLGLGESQWATSAELRHFAEQYRDVYYVPEHLLTAWHLTTIWDEGIKPTKLVPDIPLDQLQDSPEEPSYEQQF
jgi:hypothetical protein